MDAINAWLEETLGVSLTVWTLTGTVVTAGVISYLVYKRFFARRPGKIFPPDVVVLYKYGTSKTTPTWSPFTTKLETFLRLTKIPYQVSDERIKSSKGKLPWLSHQGRDIADSQFCIEYLKTTFDVDLNKHLVEKEKAVAHAMRKMVEESLYWYFVSDRWVYRLDPRWASDFIPEYLIKMIMTPMVRRRLYQQGIGRHSREEVYSIARADVKALSTYLGAKPYLFGDEPAEEDCAIFGQLSTIYYSLYGGVISNYIRDDVPNLAAYIERMKAAAWPDWDQCLLKPKE